MSKLAIMKEFWSFLKYHKKLWLVPVVIIIILFGLFVIFLQNSAFAPLIYTLF